MDEFLYVAYFDDGEIMPIKTLMDIYHSPYTFEDAIIFDVNGRPVDLLNMEHCLYQKANDEKRRV